MQKAHDLLKQGAYTELGVELGAKLGGELGAELGAIDELRENFAANFTADLSYKFRLVLGWRIDVLEE